MTMLDLYGPWPLIVACLLAGAGIAAWNGPER